MGYYYSKDEHDTGAIITEDGKTIQMLKMKITVAEYRELVGKAASADAELYRKVEDVKRYKQQLYEALSKLNEIGEVFLTDAMKEQLGDLLRDPCVAKKEVDSQ